MVGCVSLCSSTMQGSEALCPVMNRATVLTTTLKSRTVLLHSAVFTEAGMNYGKFPGLSKIV